MKIGIVGLARAGKSTVFDILTGQAGGETADPTRTRIGQTQVPDERVGDLSDHFKPKKTTYSNIEFMDFMPFKGRGFTPKLLGEIRTAEALAVVIRGFNDPGSEEPRPDMERDFRALVDELVLNDLALAEPAHERVSQNVKKGAKVDPGELKVLDQILPVLSDGKPAILADLSAEDQTRIRGYGFLTLKPVLAVLNTDEETFRARETKVKPLLERFSSSYARIEFVTLSAPVERDILELDVGDRGGFLADLGLEETARDRLIRSCFSLLEQICFFTVGEDEVRSWTIRRGTNAQRAAGRIHSDLEKGFIRAEVVGYRDFHDLGGFPGCKAAGKFRLEGKEYTVQDGDILNIRFNV